MNIYFVRHGESTENAYHLVNPLDSALTDLGKSQSELVAKRFQNIKIDRIFCSNTKRAKQTAETINKYQKTIVEETELAGEQLPPTSIWGKKETDPKSEEFFNLRDKNIHDPKYRYADEETFEDFTSRVFKFLKKLENLEYKNILVIGHGYVLRTLVGYILFGEDYNSYNFVSLRDNFKTVNTGVTLCELSKETGWKLVTWNDYSHLDQFQ